MKLKPFMLSWTAAAMLAAGALLGISTESSAQFPDKPITMVIPYGPGGGTDLATRILSTEMSKHLGQPIVVKNDAGGGGAAALAGVFNAKPDGYTIAVGTASNTSIIPFATPVGYDPLKFTYVASFFGWPYIMVIHPSIPANNLQELIAWAKANPRKLVAVTTGGFNIHEVGVGLLSQATGGFEYRSLPTNSAAEATARVVAGDANFSTGSLVTYKQHIEAGKIKALAVVSDVSSPDIDAMKLPLTRDVFKYEVSNTTVVIAPPGMSEDIRKKLQDAVEKSLQNPEVAAAINKLDFPIQYAPGPDALKVTQKLHGLYGPIVKRLLDAKQ